MEFARLAFFLPDAGLVVHSLQLLVPGKVVRHGRARDPGEKLGAAGGRAGGYKKGDRIIIRNSNLEIKLLSEAQL